MKYDTLEHVGEQTRLRHLEQARKYLSEGQAQEDGSVIFNYRVPGRSFRIRRGMTGHWYLSHPEWSPESGEFEWHRLSAYVGAILKRVYEERKK